MITNPLKKAIKSGLNANDQIGKYFAQIGSSSNPDGFAQLAYRNAERAMAEALKSPSPDVAIHDVMKGLRRNLETETRSLFVDAQQFGIEEAARQLSFFGVKDKVNLKYDSQLPIAIENGLSAVLSQVEAQEGIIAFTASYGEIDQILGDVARVGLLRVSDFSLPVSSVITSLIWNAYSKVVEKVQKTESKPLFKKQAIAALDQHTTGCCLSVHAQVRKFEDKFHLTGTPRYADYMDWPAFHWYCRTSICLYMEKYDEDLTQEMRDDADWMIAQRKAGHNPDQSPANARLE
jgi:hypothetical protein